jgi:hypothetical protein
VGLKICKGCAETKDAAEFYPNKTAANGGNICRACKRVRDTRYRDQNRGRLNGWHKSHPEQAREHSRKTDARRRQQALDAYGSVCSCCGEDNTVFLTIDHIDGGGTKHRKNVNNKVYPELRRQGFPPGYRVLCWNCNWAEYRGGCPHKDAA